MAKELRGLVRDLLRREAQGQCGACGRGGEDRVQLEQEVHRALEAVDKLNIELNETKDKLKAKVSFFFLPLRGVEGCDFVVSLVKKL